MKAKIYVTLKNGVLDPQGDAIKNSLHNIGLEKISKVSQGKYFEVILDHDDKEQAHKDVKESCEILLANTVIENYKIELTD